MPQMPAIRKGLTRPDLREDEPQYIPLVAAQYIRLWRRNISCALQRALRRTISADIFLLL